MKFKILFLLFFISDAFCGLAVNARLVNKKGKEQGFDIVTETHFVKDFQGKKPIQIMTKNGIKIELSAYFLDDEQTYGPSDQVIFQGDLFDKDGNPLGIFGKKFFVGRLGEEKKFESSKWKGQLLEFTLKSEIN